MDIWKKLQYGFVVALIATSLLTVMWLAVALVFRTFPINEVFGQLELLSAVEITNVLLFFILIAIAIKRCE